MSGWVKQTVTDESDKWELIDTSDTDLKETVDVTELDTPPEKITVLVEEVQD